MSNRYLLVSFFMISCLVMTQNGYAQNCLSEASYKITNASPGKADGQITFHFEGSSGNTDRYIILNLDAVKKQEGEDKIKLSHYEVNGLAKGYYEFVIVDRKKEKCSKEMSVEIKESENK